MAMPQAQKTSIHRRTLLSAGAALSLGALGGLSTYSACKNFAFGGGKLHIVGLQVSRKW